MAILGPSHPCPCTHPLGEATLHFWLRCIRDQTDQNSCIKFLVIRGFSGPFGSCRERCLLYQSERTSAYNVSEIESPTIHRAAARPPSGEYFSAQPMTIRRQATLYLPLPSSTFVESIRARFNRVQFDLIKAHVTLCREDEVADWSEVASRLSNLGKIEVELDFGMPVREDNLVYLPTIGSTQPFDELRSAILSIDAASPRKQNPHITLIHPRNGTCSDSAFDEIAKLCKPFSTVLRRVTLIEQHNGGSWKDLSAFG